MKTLKLMAVMLGSAFLLNCGVQPASSSSTTNVDESQLTLPLCENRDGSACTRKGPAGACDNGTEEPGACFCAQHGARFPFILVCG
jgi:hypothetical protein